jgi:MATE family multidrug resistance protein
MPAGMLSFTVISLFMGTAGYVNTFVVQYFGAKRYHRIGPALWQGIYISLFGGFVMLCIINYRYRVSTKPADHCPVSMPK